MEKTNVVSDTYNVISICSGVGGLDLAVGLAVKNAVTVCHVEREAQAAAVLAARMEDGHLHEAPVWSDLSSFDGKPWRGLVDCIISGDPCQPNSVAGSQRGADDDRFLIDELIRVIKEVRPSRVFRENVTGNADGQLAALIPTLEELGYSVAAGIFSAGEVGASHRRERLFIMAQREDGHANERRGLDNPMRGRHIDTDKEVQSGRNASLNASDNVANAERPERRPRKSAGDVSSGETAEREETPSRIGKSSEDVGYPEGLSRREGRTKPIILRGRCSADSAGLSLDDPQGGERVMGKTERREPQEHIAGRGGDLADANGGRSGTRRCQSVGEQHLQLRCQSDSGERELADTLQSEPQGEQSGEHHTEGWEVKDGFASLHGRTRLFAPGPSDPSWQCLVTESPFLAPSLAGLDVAQGSFSQAFAQMGEAHGKEEAKSIFRRMADGLASRVDRLRAGGNGVCSMAGAIAWLSLSAHFEKEEQ